MRSALLILALIGGVLAGQGFGFIFHDPGTCAELVAFKASQYGQMAQELGYSAEQIAKLQQQIQKFQEYKAQFDKYYGTFAECYRAINSGSWQGMATTINQLYLEELARRQDEIDEAEAAQAQEDAYNLGIVSQGAKMTRADIDQTARALQNTEYYRKNTQLRKEVDDYLNTYRANYEYNNSFLLRVTAVMKTIKAHNATIAQLEAENKRLSTGDDQQSLVAQMALNNQLMIENMKLQTEVATLNALLAGHDADMSIQYQRGLFRESESGVQRSGAIEQILAPLSNSSTTPSPKR